MSKYILGGDASPPASARFAVLGTPHSRVHPLPVRRQEQTAVRGHPRKIVDKK